MNSTQVVKRAADLRIKPLALLLGLTSAIALLAACGGGGGDANDGEVLEKALASVTDDQLAVMALTADELSEVLDLRFEVACNAEEIDNERAAERSVPEEDTAADQERAGRINGYRRSYPFFGGAGDMSVSVEVELYQDAASASGARAKLVDDVKALEGRTVGESGEVASVETFAVDGLAGEATGIRVRLADSSGPDATAVVFTFARLLITVARSGDDGTDASQVEGSDSRALAAIARAQEERIRRVLIGDVVDTPAPQPTQPIFRQLEARLAPGNEAQAPAPCPGAAVTRVRVDSVDLEHERLNFRLIGPYTGSSSPNASVTDDQGSFCDVTRQGPLPETLPEGDEAQFSVEYDCAEGRTFGEIYLLDFLLSFSAPPRRLAPGTEAYSGQALIIIESVDFELERIDFSMIGPATLPDPSYLGTFATVVGCDPVVRGTPPVEQTTTELPAGERRRLSLQYDCPEGRAPNEVVLWGVPFAVDLSPVSASVPPPTMPMLLSPVDNAPIGQNDPTIGCPSDEDRGYGHRLYFDWTESSSAVGILWYEIVAERESAQLPIVHDSVTTSEYSEASCNAFVADANLEGWRWRVRAIDAAGRGSGWTPYAYFRFEPCRIGDLPCSAPQ